MAQRSAVFSAISFLVCAVATTTTWSAVAAQGDDEGGGGDANADGANANGDTTEDASDSGDAEADEQVATNDRAKKTVKVEERGYGHKGQWHVRLGLGVGYRIVMRYDNSPPCAKELTDAGEERTFCGFGAPPTFDTTIGYAPLDGLEPFLWGRFGLTGESVSHTSPLVILGAGVRLYTMSDSAFKFFVEPAVGVELEKGKSDAASLQRPSTNEDYQYKQDFIVKLAIGPQFDFSPYVGAYVSGGLTMGMLRALQSWMDLHGGVQVRFP